MTATLDPDPADLRALVKKAENTGYQVVDLHVSRLTALLAAAEERDRLRENQELLHQTLGEIVVERDRLREANEAFLAEYQARLLSAATVANRHAARLAALSEKEDR